MQQTMKLGRPHLSGFDQVDVLVLPNAIRLQRMP
jgi:hypothetical protein